MLNAFYAASGTVRAYALEIAEAREGRPIPVAAHRTGDYYCVVYFIIKQSDGWWRTEVVPVHGGDVGSYGGELAGLFAAPRSSLANRSSKGRGAGFLKTERA